MNKHMRLLLLGITASLGLTLGASAEFSKTNIYEFGTFTDVASTAWYSESVKNAYEFGIMQGDSASTFSPEGNLTVAEGITIAARIHETMNGIEIKEADGEWYKMYVDYAIENEIMEEDTFSDYNIKIKRSEMATLLANACGEMPAINNVDKVADINEKAPYLNDIISLYNAGILTGNDEYGNFAPSSYLTRAEMATMAVRVADSSKRISKTFEEVPKRTYLDGYGLIATNSGTGRTNNDIANGWNYDNRFELSNTSGWGKKYVADTDDTIFTALIRDFDKESEGTLTLAAMTELWSTNGGLYMTFQNDKEERLFGLRESDGKWVICGAEDVYTDISVPTSLELVAWIMNVDLDNNTMSVTINNKHAGTVSIPADVVVERLVLGTNEKGQGSINISHVDLYKNYAVFDRFHGVENMIGEVPINYSVKGDFSVQMLDCGEEIDIYSVKGNVKAGEEGYAIRTFEPIYGNVDIKTHILLPKVTDGASFSLLTAGSEVLTIYTKNNKFYIGNKKLKSFNTNIWQDIRIEANTETGEAVIKICSQTVATVPFDASYIDGVKYTFNPDTDAEIWFDDLEIQCRVEHEDYVPEPQVAESDYLIGMYSCYLWRDGISGEGWDSVSSFREFEPVLGFYDEGLVEAADWEIKQMVEHGIDFVEFCWYAPEDEIVNPVKRSGVSHEAIHDGFLNAKYSNLMQYCLLWETSYRGASDFENFKKYMWNYWKDYYFSDDRYLVIDNKIVIFTWTGAGQINRMVGEENAKEAMEWLERDIQDSLGYDGIIWMSQNLLTGESVAKPLLNAGFAGAGARLLGQTGNNADYQLMYYDNQERIAKEFNLAYVPCIETGYNDIGRNNARTGLLSREEHLRVCEYVKDLMESRTPKSDLDRMIMIDSWNEYSEGHVSSPTAELGYMYLDNIRKVFTDAPDEHDELDKPLTAEQKLRISRFYPENHSPIRWFMKEGSENENIENSRDRYATNGANAIPVITWDMSTTYGLDSWAKGHGLSNYYEGNGVISGTASGDSSIYIPDSFGLANNPINIDEIDIVHVRVKTTVNDSGQIYFSTVENPGLGESKKINFEITHGEHDYYVRVDKHAEWKGLLTQMRIDILNTNGSFEVSLIELMKSKYNSENPAPELIVNGNKHMMVFAPVETDDGDYEIAAEATMRGFFSIMRLYHEWDRFTGDGVLTVKTRDKKTYVFNVGSNKVIVDGVEQDLGYTFKLRDGLPVFHIKKFCDLIGYEYSMENGNIVVKAATEAELALLNSVSMGQWDYTKMTEVGDWKPRQTSVSVSDGCLVMIPSGTDASITSKVDFKAEDFTHALIGIKYTEGAEKWILNLFFGTDKTDGVGSSTCLIGYVKDSMEGVNPGEIIEVKLDMTSNAKWLGTINMLRFDPHWEMDPVYIQYIKFIKDEENASFENNPQMAGGTGSSGEVVDETPPYKPEISEGETVDKKYGLLLGTVNFENLADPMKNGASYINAKYMDEFNVRVFAPLSAAYSSVADSVGKALDIVPNGTSVYRIAVNTNSKELRRGRYTVTADIYTPAENSDYLTFRFDVNGIGSGTSAEITPVNESKGSWYTATWSFDVLAVNDGRAIITDGITTKTTDVSEINGANIWLIKGSESTEEHYYYDNVKFFWDPGTLNTGYVDPNAPVVFEVLESDVFHKKHGVLIGEVDFSSEGNASYANERLLSSMLVRGYGMKTVGFVDGIVAGKKKGDMVFDYVPDGTASSRLNVKFGTDNLLKGKYTVAMDVFVPSSNSDLVTFRNDMVDVGVNQIEVLNKGKGRWQTVEWSVEILSVNDKQYVVTDGKRKVTVDISSPPEVQLWVIKSSSSTTEHIYFDNVKVYYDSGTIGTDPEYVEEKEDEVFILHDNDCNIVLDEPDIVDEELGVLLGEISFDYSYKMGSDLLKPDSRYKVHGSYVNGNYLGAFRAEVFEISEAFIEEGIENVTKADSFVLDVVSDSSKNGRVSICARYLNLMPGTYTYTFDMFITKSASDFALFRFDILGAGFNVPKEVSETKGEWTTLSYQFEVKESENKGEVVVVDPRYTSTISKSSTSFDSHLWFQKSYSNIYFDNIRLYFKPADISE